MAGPKGERQMHRDILHTEVRRAEVEERACKRYPLHGSETQHSPVKSVHVSPRATPDPPVQNRQASPSQRYCQNWSQVQMRSLVSTSPNPWKRHLEAVGNQSSRCEIGVQLGVIKEGWVGLLKHINMDVYVLMNLTGSSWEHTKKNPLFFTWATCLKFVARLILNYIYLYLTFTSHCCLHLDPG